MSDVPPFRGDNRPVSLGQTHDKAPAWHAGLRSKAGEGIPVLHLFTDLHDDYHRASDDADKVSSAGITRIAAYAARAVRAIADRPARLTVRQAAAPAPRMAGSGTGVYLESDPAQTYFCTCYGLAEVSATNDKESTQTVAAKHHDEPLYILANEKPGANIRKAPFKNHTDQELMLIETLVGRTPPIVFPKDDYKAPRRQY